jgi:hypothetical protein
MRSDIGALHGRSDLVTRGPGFIGTHHERARDYYAKVNETVGAGDQTSEAGS